jgi:hypothetical protein
VLAPPLLAARSLSIKGVQHGGPALDSYNVCVCVGSAWKNFPGTAHTEKHVVFIYKIMRPKLVMHEKNDHNYLGYLANHEASQSATCDFGQSGHWLMAIHGFSLCDVGKF